MVAGRITSTIDHTSGSVPPTRTSDCFWIDDNQDARSGSAATADDHPAPSSHARIPESTQSASGPARSTGRSGVTGRKSSSGVIGRCATLT